MVEKKIFYFFLKFYIVTPGNLFPDDTHLEVPMHQVHLSDAVFHLFSGADHHLHCRVLSDHLQYQLTENPAQGPTHSLQLLQVFHQWHLHGGRFPNETPFPVHHRISYIHMGLW